MIFSNFTSTVLHPDNLQILHFAATFYVTYWATRQKSMPAAILALAIASVGVWTKQTGAFLFMAPLIVIATDRNLSLNVRIGMISLAVLMFLAALFSLWSFTFSKFYTFDLLRSQPVHWKKLIHVFQEPSQSLWIITFVLTAANFEYLHLKGKTNSPFWRVWAWFGLFGVAPNLLSYAKIFGLWNNFAYHSLVVYRLLASGLSDFCELAGGQSRITSGGIHNNGSPFFCTGINDHSRNEGAD